MRRTNKLRSAQTKENARRKNIALGMIEYSYRHNEQDNRFYESSLIVLQISRDAKHPSLLKVRDVLLCALLWSSYIVHNALRTKTLSPKYSYS